MSAAVPAAAVTAATTVEAATAANRATAAHCAAAESAADCLMGDTAAKATAYRSAPAVAGAKTASAPTAPAPTTSAPASVEPRACSDEQSAGEVARTVVSVRRTGIRVIPIVAVSADRSWANVPRADADAHSKALSASVRSQSQGCSKYRKNQEIFREMFHFWAPSEPVEPF